MNPHGGAQERTSCHYKSRGTHLVPKPLPPNKTLIFIVDMSEENPITPQRSCSQQGDLCLDCLRFIGLIRSLQFSYCPFEVVR